MERPEISLMGIQSGDTYLTNKLNEYSKYSDYLEEVICSLCASEGMNPPKDLIYLFKKWKYE